MILKIVPLRFFDRVKEREKNNNNNKLYLALIIIKGDYEDEWFVEIVRCVKMTKINVANLDKPSWSVRF